MRALLSVFPYRLDDPRFDLNRRYTEEVTRDISAFSTTVPSFCIYLGNSLNTKGGRLLEEQDVLLCFG